MLDLSELPSPIIRYGAGIWRRRWIIVGVAWLAALLGWAAISRIPDTYQSQAHVYIQEALVDPLLSNVAASPDYRQRVDALKLSLLTFPNVEEMVYRANLDSKIDAITPLDRQAQLERLVNGVAGRIRINSPRDMYFVINYSSQSPDEAKNIVDAAVNILIEQDLGVNLRQSENSEEKLQATLRDYENQLIQQEQEIARYRRINVKELASSLSDQQDRERRRTDLQAIRDSIFQTRQRVEVLRARLAVTPRVSTNGELETLKVQLAQLRSQYNDNYPDIQNLLGQIARLESDDALPDNTEYVRIQTELRSAQDALRGLQVREERAEAEIERETVTSGQSPLVVAELQRLERSYAETQNIYSKLISSRDALALRKTLDSDGQGLEYIVFERPRKALVPSDPPRDVLILAVVVLAFGAGGAVALVFTFLERTYTQSSDLEQAFDLPVLGALSSVPTRKSRIRNRFDFARLVVSCVALFLLCFVYIYVAVLHPQASLLKNGDAAVTAASIGGDQTEKGVSDKTSGSVTGSLR